MTDKQTKKEIKTPDGWPENPYPEGESMTCEMMRDVTNERDQTILRWLTDRGIGLIERYDWTSDKFQENFDGFDRVDYCEDFKEQIRIIFGMKDKDNG